MDAGMVIVLLLSACALAFLIWVEINSRRNDANKKEAQVAAQPPVESIRKEAQSTSERECQSDKAHAA